MSDPKRLKDGVEVAILAPPPPVRLDMNNFVLEKAFNMFLRLNKILNTQIFVVSYSLYICDRPPLEDCAGFPLNLLSYMVSR